MRIINDKDFETMRKNSALPKKCIHPILALVISVGILYFLFKNIKLEVFLFKVKQINPFFIGIVIGVYLLHCFFRALRFSIVTRTELKYVYMISAIHSLLNKILPFRTGELTWPILMKKYLNIQFVNSLAWLFLLRYLDIFCVIGLFTLAALLVRPVFVNTPMIVFLGMFLIIQAVGILNIKVFIKFISAIFEHMQNTIFENPIKKIADKLHKIQQTLTVQDYLRIIGFLIALTLLNWMTLYVLYYIYIVMFNVEVTFLEVIISASFVAIGNNLPINTFGGFGTFELTWAAGFILLGMPNDVIIPIGLFVNVSNTLLACFAALTPYILLNSFSRVVVK